MTVAEFKSKQAELPSANMWGGVLLCMDLMTSGGHMRNYN